MHDEIINPDKTLDSFIKLIVQEMEKWSMFIAITAIQLTSQPANQSLTQTDSRKWQIFTNLD